MRIFQYFIIFFAVLLLSSVLIMPSAYGQSGKEFPQSKSPLLAAPMTSILLQHGNARSCPTNATSLRGTGRSLTCRCSASATQSGSVWGSGTYTDDSRICRAAVHAGIISTRGGIVTLRASAGLSSYSASSRNGVSSGKWGRWHGSYRFTRGSGFSSSGGGLGGNVSKAFCPYNAKAYRGTGRTISCGCAGSETRAGSVWGSGIYTDDSRICRAAMHAGVIGISGGNVTFRMVGPRSSYAKSSRNGVTTGSYGRWHGSFRFIGGSGGGGFSGSSGGSSTARWAVYYNCRTSPCQMGVANQYYATTGNARYREGWRRLSGLYRDDNTAWRTACNYHYTNNRYRAPDISAGRVNCASLCPNRQCRTR